jgi:hypothetical protein
LLACLALAAAMLLLFAYVSVSGAADDQRQGTAEIGGR